MKFILNYLKKYKWWVAFVLTVKLMGTICELMIPYILEYMIDDIVPTGDFSRLILWGAIMAAAALVTRTLNVMANRRSVKTARDCTYEIRRDLFWKSINLSGDQMDEIGLPSLTSRMTSDTYNLQSFIQSAQSLGTRAPIMLIGGIAVTMTMDTGLAMILLVIMPLLLVLVVGVSMKGVPLYDKVQQSLDDIVRIMRENISGIRVVKALSKEDYEKERFDRANAAMAKKDIFAGVVMGLPGPMISLFLNVGLVAVVIIGAKRVNAGITEPGVILAFLTYFSMIVMGVMGLNRIFMLFSKANASARRIAAVISTEDPLLPLPEDELAHTDREGYIVFDDVSFSYTANTYGDSDDVTDNKTGTKEPHMLGADRKLAVEHIDFAIKKGGTLGIIGPTGCGKSTIANLLMRFYDTTEGHVFVDGLDVRGYDKDRLHRMFGVVFQNDVVFADTLRNNIIFGRDVTEENMRAAAEHAHATEFIRDYEDEFDHPSVIHGANFSGGQKQRIIIARALAADPDILILDDSSSALDYKTDAALRNAIRTHHSGTTMIVVAQRISSIMSMDEILVMDDGRIIGKGTHDELMDSCSMYRDIYRTQMGGEQ